MAHRRRLALALSALRMLPLWLSAALLAECATMTPEQCMHADWRQIGFSDGTNGFSGARINDHAKACAERGVRPNLDEYLRGREQGLQTYCQPENGFAVGRRGGNSNAADCPDFLKQTFLDQYWRGQQIRQIEEDLLNHRLRVDSNHRQIRHNDERIAGIRKELAKEDLPADRRKALLNDFNRLVEQKNHLGHDNAFLLLESGRLQAFLSMRLREYEHWR